MSVLDAMRGPLVGALAMLAACSSSNSNVGAAADAGSDAPPPVGAFACVGNVSYPAPASSTVSIDAFHNVDPTLEGLAGVTVKTCALDDVDCKNVLETHVTDANGDVPLMALPTGTRGFEGYFEVSTPNDRPNLDFVNPPIGAHRSMYRRVFWSNADLKLVLDSAGLTQDVSRGFVGVEVHDCEELPSGMPCDGCLSGRPSGISVSIDVQDPAIVRAYIVSASNGQYVVSTTATATDAAGDAQLGFVNVPPGPVNLTATIAQTGQVVARQRVFARAGALTFVVLPPTPLN